MSDLRLDGVTKRFDGDPAVEDVDLTVESGELLALVGPSGCGKTTLLRIVAGLETPDAGEVYVGDERVTDLPARERDVALMFQDYALFPHMTVRENVGFNCRMRGVEDVDERVAEAAALLDIEDLLDRSVETLSGGQKQRTALGRAIADEPSAFLFDEPLANLDASLRERTRTELARLQSDLGVTTVHVTHDQREALTMGDRVAVMRAGSIQQVATPEEVYRRPANLFVARFVGRPEINTFEGRVDGGEIAIGSRGVRNFSVPIDLDDPGDEAVVVGVRPEHVSLDARGSSQHAARVVHVAFEGADAFVHLRSDVLGEVIARVRADQSPDEGDRVRIDFDPSAIHVFDAEDGVRIPRAGEVTARLD